MPALNAVRRSDSEVEIVWRAYELRPEPVPLPDAASGYFKRMWETQVYPLARELGVEMKMPDVKPRSRAAHEAAKWSASVGRFEEFSNGLFRSYFGLGGNIGEIDTLLAVASELSLDSGSLEESLNSGRFRDKVISDEDIASKIGISFVPAFVVNRQNALGGLQTKENLLALINSVKG